MEVKITVKAYASDIPNTNGLFFIEGVTGRWKEELKVALNAEDVNGTLKTTIDPIEKMESMRIKFNLEDYRVEGKNAGAAAQENKPDASIMTERVWTYGNSICVRIPRLKDDKDLRARFKTHFVGASFNGENEKNPHWVIPNADSKHTEDAVKQFLSIVDEGTTSSYQMTGQPNEYLLTKEEGLKFHAALGVVLNGGVLRIA